MNDSSVALFIQGNLNKKCNFPKYMSHVAQGGQMLSVVESEREGAVQNSISDFSGSGNFYDLYYPDLFVYGLKLLPSPTPCEIEHGLFFGKLCTSPLWESRALCWETFHFRPGKTFDFEGDSHFRDQQHIFTRRAERFCRL